MLPPIVIQQPREMPFTTSRLYGHAAPGAGAGWVGCRRSVTEYRCHETEDMMDMKHCRFSHIISRHADIEIGLSSRCIESHAMLMHARRAENGAPRQSRVAYSATLHYFAADYHAADTPLRRCRAILMMIDDAAARIV